MNLENLVRKMQRGFDTSLTRPPSPFSSRQNNRPSFDVLDSIRLQQIQWLRKRQGRQRTLGDARFSQAM